MGICYHDELEKTFKNRIETQSRTYKDGALLFRTYHAILSSKDFAYKDEYENKMKAYIGKFKFIVTDIGDTDFLNKTEVKFNEVDRIEFGSDDSTHLFLKNGEEKLVLTEVFNSELKGGTYELYKGDLDDLSLDHRIPLVKLVNSMQDYPEMKYLSDQAIKYYNEELGKVDKNDVNDKPVPKADLDKYCAASGYFFTDTGADDTGKEKWFHINREKLLVELFDFLSKTEIVMMSRKCNSSKNGN